MVHCSSKGKKSVSSQAALVMLPLLVATIILGKNTSKSGINVTQRSPRFGDSRERLLTQKCCRIRQDLSVQKRGKSSRKRRIQTIKVQVRIQINFNKPNKYWTVSRKPRKILAANVQFICKSNYAISNYRDTSERAATGQGVVVSSDRSAQTHRPPYYLH